MIDTFMANKKRYFLSDGFIGNKVFWSGPLADVAAIAESSPALMKQFISFQLH